MSQVDRAYYIHRAGEERARVVSSQSPEVRAIHQQLFDLYLLRAGHPLEGADFAIERFAHG